MSDDDQVLKALNNATGTPGKGRRLLSAGLATAAVPLLAYAGHKGYQHLKGKKKERVEEIEKQAQYDVLRAYGLEKAAELREIELSAEQLRTLEEVTGHLKSAEGLEETARDTVLRTYGFQKTSGDLADYLAVAGKGTDDPELLRRAAIADGRLAQKFITGLSGLGLAGMTGAALHAKNAKPWQTAVGALGAGALGSALGYFGTKPLRSSYEDMSEEDGRAAAAEEIARERVLKTYGFGKPGEVFAQKEAGVSGALLGGLGGSALGGVNGALSGSLLGGALGGAAGYVLEEDPTKRWESAKHRARQGASIGALGLGVRGAVRGGYMGAGLGHIGQQVLRGAASVDGKPFDPGGKTQLDLENFRDLINDMLSSASRGPSGV